MACASSTMNVVPTLADPVLFIAGLLPARAKAPVTGSEPADDRHHEEWQHRRCQFDRTCCGLDLLLPGVGVRCAALPHGRCAQQQAASCAAWASCWATARSRSVWFSLSCNAPACLALGSIGPLLHRLSLGMG